MKVYIPFLLCINLWICALTSNAQKEYNIWYFGQTAGITFNTNPPSALTNSMLNSYGSSSGMCDSAGNLLFYTKGDNTFNRLHLPLKNGASLPALGKAGAWQGSLALPVPAHPHLYYVFSSPWPSATIHNNLLYSIIDMQGDNGLGEVIVKDKPLFPLNDQTGGVAVCRHANKTDYWIGSHTDSFFISVRTKNGLIDTTTIRYQPIPSRIYQVHADLATVKFSPDSRIFAYGTARSNEAVPEKEYLSLFRFDNSTGKLHDSIRILLTANFNTTHVHAAHLEFSPDSRFLYVAIDSQGSAYKTCIAKYDLSVWDAGAIKASATIIPRTPALGCTGMQLGPDGKIYIFWNTRSFAGVINEPNLSGFACGFEDTAILFQARKNGNSGPYFPNFRIPPAELKLGNDTVLCEGDTLFIDSKMEPHMQIRWNNGDTSPVLKVHSSGTYGAMLYDMFHFTYDTIRVSVKHKPIVYIGPDTAFCGKFSHVLDAGKDKKQYYWSTGDTTMSIMVNKPGYYSVSVKDSNVCMNGDTISIEQLLLDSIQLSYDHLNCNDVRLDVHPLQPGVSYSWDQGSTGSSISVQNKGSYTVTASNLFCSLSRSVNVNRLSLPEFTLGPDTNLCERPFVLLKATDGDTYLWNTGQTSPYIYVYDSGSYHVKVSRNNCSMTDTVKVGPDCEGVFHIPSAFSPNGDGLNDVFCITGAGVEQVKMSIFDRWGEELFSGSGKTVSWDGSYKGQTCPEGVYTYMLSVTAKNSKGRKHYPSGTLTLIK